jgi:hypothetical protein
LIIIAFLGSIFNDGLKENLTLGSKIGPKQAKSLKKKNEG